MSRSPSPAPPFPTGPAGRTDNFDAVRIAAAFAVLVSHAYTLSGRGDEPLFALSGGRVSIGSAAVLVFFSISGFLIAGSYGRSRDPAAFVRARALRILPGLAAVLVVSAFVLGPALTRRPLGAYFGDRAPYAYVYDNLLMRSRYLLPGVFGGLPYPDAVNGSLWTLQPEVQCYAAVLALGLAGALRPRVLAPALLALMAAGAFRHGPRMETVDFFTAFAAGALARLWPGALRPAALAAGIAASLAVVALFAAGRTGFAPLDVAGAALTLGLCRSRRLRLPRLGRWGDVSYGVYIWAFPTQQVVEMSLRGAGGPAANVALAGPATLLLAYASWHLVEAPCLRLKGRAGRPAAHSMPSGPTALESQPTVPSRHGYVVPGGT